MTQVMFSETVKQTQRSDTSDKLECLRKVDVSVLEAANSRIRLSAFFATFVFVPVVDGSFIVERPTVTLERKRVNGLSDPHSCAIAQLTIFVDSASPPPSLTEYVTELFPLLDQTSVQSIVQMYTDDKVLTTTLSQAVAVMGESIFICPTYLLMSAFGDRAYKGEFAIPPGWHAEDLEYHFPTGFQPTYNNSALIKSFLSVVRALNTTDKFVLDLKPAWSVWQLWFTCASMTS
ncbi:uncharacterized protein C8Q71DRAFT_860223 [Rhodofomes roseus]|uniref:Carboxylesterase type B domain-containing protein n=1 Tax=Rhodofomes roseus TaxID=34475 RepID=A0ABQ8K8B0_9APHY|nr:uncharacterized protein C8Q71DRAFT_860223 [Rhodofomes roseus]KAH9833429.1 hypothetical protein C8Q71DRAFT_860223 [Rhodofomes roseus]